MDSLGLIVTVVVAAVGATWALRSKLGDVELAVARHVEEDVQTHKAIEGRVVKLEQRRPR